MADHWWQRLFQEDDETDAADGAMRSPSSRTPVGRFQAADRHVEVKMFSQYPQHRERDEEKAENQNTAAKHVPLREPPAHHVKKTPFRLTEVPSPVFGYRRPRPQQSPPYLEAAKEGREKRQIEERKRQMPLHQEQQPALNKKSDEPGSVKDNAAAAARVQPDVSKHDTEKMPPVTAADAATHSVEKKRSEDSGEILAVNSRLPRSPHRSGAQTKVPFNVLMFRSDHGARPAARPRQENPRTETEEPRLPLSLLNDPVPVEKDSVSWIEEKKATLIEVLHNFHVEADVVGYVQGPSVTRYDLHLHPGVKINKVLSLTEDIKLNLAARQIRIAPVPGTSAVGIEIPNRGRRPVLLKELLVSDAFRQSRAPLTVALGQDVSGHYVVTDLAKMPHGLIAGATGSGKSVCIHSFILSLIYNTSPEDLRLLLVDPKVVEMAPYRDIPHLAAPVITEPKEAAAALKWAVDEMERRYRLFAACAVRDMDGYNRKSRTQDDAPKLPYIVIIIDELADLMMAAPQEVEESVCRIAQKARAAGIHLLVATQRPSVDVITGLIKSNIPTRIAFSVSSQTDSRTILDCGGAERLLGRGDLLFAENGSRSPRRLQGCYVSDEEISRVTAAFHHHPRPDHLFSPEDIRGEYERSEQEDELLEEAAAFVVDQGQASVSSIQRHFRVGYNRAARLVDELEMRRIISATNGSKPRQVLVSGDRLKELLSADSGSQRT